MVVTNEVTSEAGSSFLLLGALEELTRRKGDAPAQQGTGAALLQAAALKTVLGNSFLV